MYNLLLTGNSGSSTVIFIIGIVLIIILVVIATAAKAPGMKGVKKEYAGKIKQEIKFKYYDCFLTDSEFAIAEKNKKDVSIYSIKDICFIRSCKDMGTGNWQISFYDSDKAALKGDVHNGKKRRPRKIAVRYFPKQAEGEKLCEILMNVNPQITKLGFGE
ncbi:MAG: hypothetical protein J5685_06365 [Clostridiales bacterium]|nr:hypothetical protein [Clostridiales bacterium]